MKKILIIIFVFSAGIFAQKKPAYKNGEKIKYRIHYGVVNAGYASIEVKDEMIDNTPYEHVIGKGWTSGMLKWVFPVEDNYESYIKKETGYPIRAIRQIKEGGYTKNVELLFEKDSVLTIDHKHNREKKTAATHVQDMISAFYYLRNHVPDEMKVGDEIEIDMFFDHKKFDFKLIKLRKETLKTKFGNIECFVFRPIVKSGRVFKEQESLTLWVSNDLNKIPIRIKADLAVGSIKADLDGYNGLKNQFKIIMD